MPADPNMKILVVDDFTTIRRIITNSLNDMGFMNVHEADDGTRALEVMRQEKIDFVITDWNMPKMSGLDLLKAIRESSENQHIPVLMVTAEAMQDNILKAAHAGVTNYIVKPFDAKTLQEKIAKIFP